MFCVFVPLSFSIAVGFEFRRTVFFAERKGQRKGKGVYASLFGVGAPEALVIGVVALLVFGPKGLAEVSSYFIVITNSRFPFLISLWWCFLSCYLCSVE